jgi:predicted acyl esterase
MNGVRCRTGLRVCSSGCNIVQKKLYLKPKRRWVSNLRANCITTADYVSDPAKPVPYRARPILPVGYEGELTWPRWLVDDQREASGRTDVLTFTSPILTAPVKTSGEPIAHLNASTTGTDADWS